MATVVNERDVLIMGAPERVVDYNLPPNVIVPTIVGLSLTAPGEIFRVATNGDVSPSAITMTVNLRGLPPDTPITWQVTYGDLATDPAVTGLSYTLDETNMVSDVVTIEASVVVAGFTYRDAVSFARIQDGSIGLPGSRGSINAARAITGTLWSDTEAVQALVDYGVSEPVAPIAGDVVTLHNLSARFVETRRFGGAGWLLQAPSIPGMNILPGTVATESLLVTGMAEALNSDPNTVDRSAWTGGGLEIVTDTSAPNGVSALQMSGQGVTVLSRPFPVNEGDNYQVRAWVKDHGGTGSTMFLLVAFYNAAGALIEGSVAPSGWDDTGTHHYFGLVNEAPTNAWVEHSAAFGADETFKVPAGARSARVGAISNFLSPGVQRISGALCRRKVDGRVVVDGSLAARHIDARELTIRNADGDVLLEAGGSSTPPWIVNVDNRVDPLALSLAAPADNGNRSAIRGISVDQVDLTASYSPTGNSIVLNSAAAEIWRVTYANAMPVFLADGRVFLDHSQLPLEANTTYLVTYDVVAQNQSAVAGQVAFYADIPAGARYAVSTGAQSSSHPGGQVLLGTVDGVDQAAVVDFFSPTTYQVFIRTGASGGLLRLMGQASGANCAVTWGTRFSAQRLKRYVTPELFVPTSAVVRDLGAVRALSNSGFSLVTGQPYKAIQQVYVVMSSPTAGATPVVAIVREALTQNILLLVDVQQLSTQAIAAGRTMMNHNAVLDNVRRVMHISELVSGIPASESSRWQFRVRRVSVSHPEFFPSLNYHQAIRDATPISHTLPQSNSDWPSTTEWWYSSPEDLYVYPGNMPGATAYSVVLDYFIQPFFMSQAQGPEQCIRVVINLLQP